MMREPLYHVRMWVLIAVAVWLLWQATKPEHPPILRLVMCLGALGLGWVVMVKA